MAGVRLAAAVGLLSVVAVAGLLGPPARHAAVDSVSRTPAGGATKSDPGTYERPLVTPPPQGTASRALYRFALAFGTVSSHDVSARYRRLLSLAAPPLSQALQRAAPRSEFEALRGLPPGARIQASVVSLALGAARAGVQRAAIVVDEYLRGVDDASGPATQTAFVADLVKARGAWRVARFAPVP